MSTIDLCSNAAAGLDFDSNVIWPAAAAEASARTPVAAPIPGCRRQGKSAITSLLYVRRARCLPDYLRDAVLAIDLVGMSYREAARLIGVKEATITTRLHRGRRRITQAVGRDSQALGPNTDSPPPHALVA